MSDLASSSRPDGTARPSRMHHHAWVVEDLERTRRFYEDVLGLPLVATWCEVEEVRGKQRTYCHTFFELADGSALSFFQFADPDDRAELQSYRPGSLGHLALQADAAVQQALADRLTAEAIPWRIVDHGYCRSLYVVDPDGLTIELTVDAPDAAAIGEMRRRDATSELRRWLAGDHRPNNDLRAVGR
jgi:catechol 2,3-dioxygenase-like lactoylglutathione lyase family enzyme